MYKTTRYKLVPHEVKAVFDFACKNINGCTGDSERTISLYRNGDGTYIESICQDENKGFGPRAYAMGYNVAAGGRLDLSYLTMCLYDADFGCVFEHDINDMEVITLTVPFIPAIQTRLTSNPDILLPIDVGEKLSIGDNVHFDVSINDAELTGKAGIVVAFNGRTHVLIEYKNKNGNKRRVICLGENVNKFTTR